MPSAAEPVEEHILLIEVYTATTTVENYKAVSTKGVIIYPVCGAQSRVTLMRPHELAARQAPLFMEFSR